MFTIKFYSADGYRQIIRSAESFTILRGVNPTAAGCGEAEITLHQKNQADDCRFDIKPDLPRVVGDMSPPVFQKAIIENAAGKTTEIVALSLM